ncbi:hypothetical protein R3P38DRAFT_3342231 [Favolaschia claudopus]|uniref:Uncharacterized protein n=1 Tax=Favolaschia claudopus TaxID=2862362 RepID=A0AAW0DZU8_9AGAR
MVLFDFMGLLICFWTVDSLPACCCRYAEVVASASFVQSIDPPTCVDLDLAPIIESVIPSAFHSMDTHHPSLTSDHFTITRSDLPRALVILSPVVVRPPRLASEAPPLLSVPEKIGWTRLSLHIHLQLHLHPRPALIPSQTHLRALASPSPGINAPEDSTSPTVNPYRHVRPRVRVVGGSGGEARGGDWGVLALLHCWNGVVWDEGVK